MPLLDFLYYFKATNLVVNVVIVNAMLQVVNKVMEVELSVHKINHFLNDCARLEWGVVELVEAQTHQQLVLFKFVDWRILEVTSHDLSEEDRHLIAI